MQEDGTSNDGSTGTPATAKNHITNVGNLDLRSAKTADDFNNIGSITNVGCVLVPEHLVMALTNAVPMENVGSVIAIPDGENVNVIVGQTTLTGEALAAGDPNTILFIAGQLFIKTPVHEVGFRQLWVHGQVMAVRGSETALGSKLGRVTGQVFYLPEKARSIMGEESIGKAFLSLLPEPTALVVMGSLTFEADVTAELLQSKILEIVLMGQITAPKSLVPLVQVLTLERMGEIRAA